MWSPYILIVQESQQRENQPSTTNMVQRAKGKSEKTRPRKCERLTVKTSFIWFFTFTHTKKKAIWRACLPSLLPLHWLRPRGRIHWHGHSRSNFHEPPYHKLHSSTFLWFPFWNPKGYLPKYAVSQTWFSSWLFLRDLWRSPRRWKSDQTSKTSFAITQHLFCLHKGMTKKNGLSLHPLYDLDQASLTHSPTQSHKLS